MLAFVDLVGEQVRRPGLALLLLGLTCVLFLTLTTAAGRFGLAWLAQAGVEGALGLAVAGYGVYVLALASQLSVLDLGARAGLAWDGLVRLVGNLNRGWTGSNTRVTWGLGPGCDLDLTVSTDLEDALVFGADVVELCAQDLYLLVDVLGESLLLVAGVAGVALVRALRLRLRRTLLSTRLKRPVR